MRNITKPLISLSYLLFVVGISLASPAALAQSAALNAALKSLQKKSPDDLKKPEAGASKKSMDKSVKEVPIQPDKTEPDHGFVVLEGGIVSDTRSKLEWMQCSLGQDWNGNTCTGKARRFGFVAAKKIAEELNATGGFAKRNNWRVPTVRELQSLRFCSLGFSTELRELQDNAQAVPSYCTYNSKRPTLHAKLFPETPADWYFSSSMITPLAAVGEKESQPAHWFVNFYNGNTSVTTEPMVYFIRLVRDNNTTTP